MRYSRLLRCAALLAVAAIPLAPAAPARAQEPDSTGVGFRVPDSIGTFQLIGRKKFDQEALGFLLRYQRADGLWLDLFVYPGPDLASRCDTGCARDVLRREGDEFIAAFPDFLQRHYVDSIALISDAVLIPVPKLPWRLGRHIHAFQRRSGHDEWSDFYVFYLPGYRVKVRASYAADSLLASAVDAFASAAAPAIARASDHLTRTGAGDSQRIVITAVLRGAPADHFVALASLLARQGYTIADSIAASRLVTAPRFEWPAGTENETWHGKESPGVRLTVTLTPVGDSTRVQIMGESPMRAGWSDAKVAEMMRMMSAVQLASALSKERPDGEGRKPER